MQKQEHEENHINSIFFNIQEFVDLKHFKYFGDCRLDAKTSCNLHIFNIYCRVPNFHIRNCHGHVPFICILKS